MDVQLFIWLVERASTRTIDKSMNAGENFFRGETVGIDRQMCVLSGVS
jgi:hypothetical protein